MARVSVKAVVIGVVLDFVLSAVLAIAVVFVWGFVAASRGKPLSAGFETDTKFLVVALVIGFATLVLGGFVAGRIARHDYVLHGSLVGAISLILGALLGGPHGYPTWFNVIVFALDIPMAVLGAVLARRGKAGSNVDAVSA